MFPDDENERISSIGADLLDHAEEFGEPVRLSLTTQLFPYLLLASRKMTTREMSDWLEKTKGVKLSFVAIAKGLKRPELHLKRIAEFVQFPATFLAAVYDRSVEGLLYGEDAQTGHTAVQQLSDEIFNAPDGASSSVTSALETLQTVWDPIPQEVKFMCRRFFDFNEANDSDAENEA